MKVGILGGGQLGRMLALAAHELGMEPLVLEPKPDAPATRVAPTLVAAYDDETALREIARCDVITYEFENVPVDSLRQLARQRPVHPRPPVLAATGDRLLEKWLFAGAGIPVPRFRAVSDAAGLSEAIAVIGLPAVLKTRRFGYDGRGQLVLRSRADVERAQGWLAQPLLLEEYVDFDREVSLLAARGQDGETRFWAPVENRHVDGVLRVSRAPAPTLAEPARRRAERWVRSLLEQLDYVGVLAVEFFVRGDAWLANEAACRVHNSGHWTLGGATTSQFENHLRAVAGLPLGATDSPRPAAMVNLVGALPRPAEVLSVPGARLFDYGKAPLPGRKLGHVSLVAETDDEIEDRLRALANRVPDPAVAAALARAAASAA